MVYFEPTQQPSNEHPLSPDVTFENPTFDPDGPGDDDYSFDLPDPPFPPPPPPPWNLRQTSSTSLTHPTTIYRTWLASWGRQNLKPRKSASLTVSTTKWATQMGCAPKAGSTIANFGSMPTAKHSTGPQATRRSLLLRRGEDSGSWL